MIQEKKIAYILANFGGPRNLNEINSFLSALLLDRDVIRQKMPFPLHDMLFRRIANKRSIKIRRDYMLIGGRSPIYEDTETLASNLRRRLNASVVTFHRYLEATHQESLQEIEQLECDEIHVFPLFPQFTYATTGSIARFFKKRLSRKAEQKLRWVKSYATHPAFISLTFQHLRTFLIEHNLVEAETFFIFSAHGLPQYCIESGDPYQSECEDSFRQIMALMRNATGVLSYQSKFGPDEWIKPYTSDVCASITTYAPIQDQVVFIPISFTSDHIETLFEIEHEYMRQVAGIGKTPYRLPALNSHPSWVDTIAQILDHANFVTTSMLIRQRSP